MDSPKPNPRKTPARDIIHDVEVEIVRDDLPSKTIPATPEKTSKWFHPLSAILMIVCDFGGTLPEIVGVAVWVMMLASIFVVFSVTFIGVTFIQRFMEKDSWTTAWIKGVIAGILCAIPWPVFGTAAGSFILIKSGIEEGIPMLLKRAKK